MSRSRRSPIARRVAGAALLLLVTAGCGDTPDDERASAEPSEDGAFPVTIEHAFGTSVIEAEPQRVVVAGFNETDYLYSLGIAPVAAHEWWGGYDFVAGPWAEDLRKELGAEPEVLEEWDINVEWVAAQEPDLIVAAYADLDRAVYDQLSRIAPVVAQHEDYAEWETPWREQLRQIAEAVGRSDRAEEVIADVDATIAELVAAHPEFAGATFDTGGLDDSGSFSTYSSGDIVNQLLAELGMKVPEEYDEMADGVYVTISPERADLLDLLDVFVVLDETGTMTDTMADIPTFASTRLHQEGRVVAPDRDVVLAMSFNTPLSIPYYLAELEPMLVAALDGDPDTPVRG